MRRGEYPVYFKCTYPDCNMQERRIVGRQAEEIRQRNTFRCAEHYGIEHRLVPGKQESVFRLVNMRSEKVHISDLLFWNRSNGYAHGPGFEARSKDWPEGTVLEVTARIILPSATGREES